MAAVAQHRDAVADARELLQPVGNVHDARAVGGHTPDDVEEPIDLASGERGGRFVHDEDARPPEERFGELHHLLLGEAEPIHSAIEIERDADVFDAPLRRVSERAAIDPAGAWPSRMFSATESCGTRLSS